MSDNKATLVEITDSLLTSMAAQTHFVAAYPFLSAIKSQQPARQGCAPCGANRAHTSALANAKNAIANLGGERKKQLLQMLNARQIRVRYQDGSRIIVKTISD